MNKSVSSLSDLLWIVLIISSVSKNYSIGSFCCFLWSIGNTPFLIAILQEYILSRWTDAALLEVFFMNFYVASSMVTNLGSLMDESGVVCWQLFLLKICVSSALVKTVVILTLLVVSLFRSISLAIQGRFILGWVGTSVFYFSVSFFSRSCSTSKGSFLAKVFFGRQWCAGYILNLLWMGWFSKLSFSLRWLWSFLQISLREEIWGRLGRSLGAACSWWAFLMFLLIVPINLLIEVNRLDDIKNQFHFEEIVQNHLQGHSSSIRDLLSPYALYFDGWFNMPPITLHSY